MDEVGEDPAGLERLSGQRARLADRVRAPWWYLAGFATVMAMVCAAPFAMHYLRWGPWSGLLAIVAFYLLQVGFARATGVAIGTRTLHYPSGRGSGIVLMVVVIGAVVAETALLNRAQYGFGVAVGIIAVAAATACWPVHLRGIRRDLRAGTGVR